MDGSPITTAGGISAEWGLTILVSIIGSLVVAIIWLGYVQIVSTLKTFKESIDGIHKRIDVRKDEHDELNKAHNVLDTEFKVLKKSNDPDQLAKLIVMELSQYNFINKKKT